MIKRIGIIIIFVAHALVGHAATANETKQPINDMLDFYISDNKQGIGAVVAVIEGNNTYLFKKGVVDKTSNSPLSNEHIFEIGSISKTFTGLLLANMVNSGEVKLNDSINEYLPDNAKLKFSKGADITLLDLVTHTSGFPRVPSNLEPSGRNGPFSDYTYKQLYDYLNNYEHTSSSPKETVYSNLGFGLLGHLLSLAANQSYEQLVDERIFKPLHMKSSFINIQEPFTSKLAVPHGPDLSEVNRWPMPVFEGAGAINSNLSDMVQYLKANMKMGNEDFLLAHKPQRKFGENNKQIGLAWIINLEQRNLYHWHNGSTGGFRSFIGFNKSKNMGIVILTNSRVIMDEMGHAYLKGGLTELVKNQTATINMLSEKETHKLTGKYQLTPTVEIEVTNDGSQLHIQFSGQKKLPVYPKSKQLFYYDTIKAEVEFELNNHNEAISLTLFQNGREMLAPKI